MRLSNFGLFATLLLAGASVASAKPLSTELKAQMSANLARGDKLYAYDQTAWHTSDAMMAAVPDALKKLLRGFVITPDGNNFRATYYGEDTSREFVVYAASWDGKQIVRPFLPTADPRPTVSADEHRLIAARSVALDMKVIGKLVFCSKGTPNVAVIPGTKVSDPISVYVMTAQTETGIWPLGGHHRIDVKDGKIISQRAFTKACLNLGSTNKDEVPLSMAISHFLDPVPTEIHAFTVHTSGVPLVVATDGSQFALSRKDGKITVVQNK